MLKKSFIKVGENLEIKAKDWDDFVDYIKEINHESIIDNKTLLQKYLNEEGYVFLKLTKHNNNKYYFKVLNYYKVVE
ncbi:hypothetical protein [Marinitoga sp. 1138]|uniref:hypothetical protein n=1 Tax=Marinitoga sp. 1138 TaxID=1643334 RepID=UPI0015866824|nr:hypothetical protein [Marinitoga sp. 1138]NUU96739.1 hypothetical protein [Marinitoga sp. 1138]